MASVVFLPPDFQELSVLLKGTADEELRTIAVPTNPICFSELFATVATIFQLGQQITGKRDFLFVDNEVACAALAKGSARNKGALPLLYALWAIAAQRDIGLWTERVPTEVNPADLPARDRDLSSETQPAQELVSHKDVLAIYDFSWVAIQRTE